MSEFQLMPPMDVPSSNRSTYVEEITSRDSAVSSSRRLYSPSGSSLADAHSGILSVQRSSFVLDRMKSLDEKRKKLSSIRSHFDEIHDGPDRDHNRTISTPVLNVSQHAVLPPTSVDDTAYGTASMSTSNLDGGDPHANDMFLNLEAEPYQPGGGRRDDDVTLPSDRPMSPPPPLYGDIDISIGFEPPQDEAIVKEKRRSSIRREDSFAMNPAVTGITPRTHKSLALQHLAPPARMIMSLFGHNEVDEFASVTTTYRPREVGVFQDMSLPLAHYFISSGHNSYLTGNQITSDCGTKPIQDALERGCRVIELDCWTGKDGPKVYHGFTMTKPISFLKCIRVINKYAFAFSSYPVIITLENHCDKANSDIMAKMLLEVFGDSLYVLGDKPKWSKYPTPSELMERILIRDKDRGDEDEEMDQITAELPHRVTERIMKMKVSEAEESITQESKSLASMVTVFNVKLDKLLSEVASTVASASISEHKIEILTATTEKDFLDITKTHLLRVYPGAKRVDSSNYNPIQSWSVGAQIAALNWQTPGPPLWVYEGMFSNNGGSGYVLKPSWMLGVGEVPNVEDPGHVLRVRVLSARRLGHRMIRENATAVELWGAGKDSQHDRTHVVRAYDACTWDKEFIFPITYIDLAVLLFVVHTGDKLKKSDFIGQVALPISNLSTGIFELPLLNRYGRPCKRGWSGVAGPALVVQFDLKKATGGIRKMMGKMVK